MGSIYYEVRNGRKYAYTSTSRRVPGKKNPVSKKVYLGRVDPDTGEIISKESKKLPAEEHVWTYGCVTVLDRIQADLGILEDLRECFPDCAEKIMAVATAVAIEPGPFDDVHFTVDANGIKDWLRLRGSMSPPVVCDLCKDIGGRLAAMDMFFSRRARRMSEGEGRILDLTSNSTYSDMGGYAEWGHNRDGESMRQAEFALVTDSAGIPLAFQMLPGSIADSATLAGLVEWMESLGIGGRLVMDRGFENAANTAMLLESGLDFTMPSNVREMPVKKLLTKARKVLKEPDSIRRHEGLTYRVAEFDVAVAVVDGKARYVTRLDPGEKDAEAENVLFDASPKVRAFVVQDPRRAAEDMDSLMDAVERYELEYEGTRRKDPEKEFSKIPPFVRKHLDWSVDDDGLMHIHRLKNSFSFESNRDGMFVMFASPGTTWERMMGSYDTRDWVEKAYDAYKTDVDGRRMRTGDPDRARARFFIKMLALIMRLTVGNALRDHERTILESKGKRDSACGLSVDAAMKTLGTLIIIVSPGYTRLTPVSKNVRELFELFGLEAPKSGAIVLP